MWDDVREEFEGQCATLSYRLRMFEGYVSELCTLKESGREVVKEECDKLWSKHEALRTAIAKQLEALDRMVEQHLYDASCEDCQSVLCHMERKGGE